VDGKAKVVDRRTGAVDRGAKAVDRAVVVPMAEVVDLRRWTGTRSGGSPAKGAVPTTNKEDKEVMTRKDGRVETGPVLRAEALIPAVPAEAPGAAMAVSAAIRRAILPAAAVPALRAEVPSPAVPAHRAGVEAVLPAVAAIRVSHAIRRGILPVVPAVRAMAADGVTALPVAVLRVPAVHPAETAARETGNRLTIVSINTNK
jgi:hypothetical protein